MADSKFSFLCLEVTYALGSKIVAGLTIVASLVALIDSLHVVVSAIAGIWLVVSVLVFAGHHCQDHRLLLPYFVVMTISSIAGALSAVILIVLLLIRPNWWIDVFERTGDYETGHNVTIMATLVLIVVTGTAAYLCYAFASIVHRAEFAIKGRNMCSDPETGSTGIVSFVRDEQAF